jgi:hypothetical protein
MNYTTPLNFLTFQYTTRKKELEFSIYRKLTQTDIIIPNNSSYPLRHKISNISYFVNKLNTYPVFKEVKEKELNIMKTYTPIIMI